MKIGINTRLYQNVETGIPKFIKNLYSTMVKIDRKNEYIFFQTSSNKQLNNTKTTNLPQIVIANILFDNFLINRLIKTEKIDIFHSPSHILPVIKFPQIKYVLTIHDLHFLYHFKFNNILFNLYYKNAIQHSLKNSDLIITDSYNTKKDIIKFYQTNEKKITVIYPGIDNIFFTKKSGKRIIWDKYFFSVTTHPQRKNIFSILKILSLSKRLFKKYKFVIAGLIADQDLIKLRKVVSSLGLSESVILLGYISQKQLVNLYQNAEFFIYPSFYEGFGFPVLEAMACRCPVISSNTSSLPELFPNKNWLVNPYNQNNIYNKMKKIISLKQSDKKKIILDNFNFAKKFTWYKSAKAYLDVFNSL